MIQPDCRVPDQRNNSPTEQVKGGEETTESEAQASTLVVSNEKGWDRLDVTMSSPNGPHTKNNETRCSKRKTIPDKHERSDANAPASINNVTHCSLHRNIDRRRAVLETLSVTPQVMTIPVSQYPSHPKACNIPPCSLQMAAPPVSSWSAERLCLHHSERLTAHQASAVIREHSKVNAGVSK